MGKAAVDSSIGVMAFVWRRSPVGRTSPSVDNRSVQDGRRQSRVVGLSGPREILVDEAAQNVATFDAE